MAGVGSPEELSKSLAASICKQYEAQIYDALVEQAKIQARQIAISMMAMFKANVYIERDHCNDSTVVNVALNGAHLDIQKED